ncbi:MAG: FxLYD domain-containing protein [Caldilinea sp.]
MHRLLVTLTATILLGLCATSVVLAQNATPTPLPPQPVDDYESEALVQLGNLRNVAGDMYAVIGVSNAVLAFYAELLQDEVRPFASAVEPPAEFAAFHSRLFLAVRPCATANTVLQSMDTDVFSFLIASSYTQACYAAVSDASAEWSHATGTAPIFANVLPLDLMLEPTAAITPAATVTAPVNAATPAPDTVSAVDDIGLTWSVSTDSDPAIILEAWTAYVNQAGDFAVTGRLRNVDASRQFSLASILVKFYDADGKLVNVEEGSASGHWVDPDEVTTFAFDTYFAPIEVASYVIEIVGGDWQE